MAVAEAWHSTPFSSRMDIPLGVVASLALIPGRDHPAEIVQIINGSSDRQLLQGLREVCVHHWARQPELAPVMTPLFAWLVEENVEDLARSVRLVVDACLREGILGMTGSSNPEERSHVDVLSWVLMELRSPGARKRLGEYHTPPHLSELVANLGAGGTLPPAGEQFMEPARGTGGIFRAIAQHVRSLGGDPADYEWWLVEIDPLAAAAAAANSIVWGLGRRVVVACGDTLRDPQVAERVASTRIELRAERDTILKKVGAIAAIRRVTTIIDQHFGKDGS
ncbi:N-6 DNA methylase [Streptomyces sp. 5.8]|uniref:N-6 DNA methylase n=1 Tax=Streptomyces sp. 5.8 TaxID=3406571 RepID=UPI003BB7BA8A